MGYRRRLVRGGLTAMVAGLSVATLASFAGRHWVYGELLSNFRLQWLVLALLSLLVALDLRSAHRSFLAAALVVANLVPVMPYLVARPGDVSEPSAGLSVLTLNLLYGKADVAAVGALVERWSPDIVVLTEISPEADAAYPPLLSGTHPFRFATSGAGSRDLRIFSRFPMTDVFTDTVDDGSPPLLSATVRTSDTDWRMLALHAPPPMLGIARRGRTLDFAALAARSAEAPYFLVGDLNVTQWSPSRARMADIGGLRDSALGHALVNTWLLPMVPFGLPLDHVLVSRDIVVTSRKVSGYLGSDHRGLLAEMHAPVR